MSQYSAIKAATNAYIKSNGMREITGAILNSVMIATINALGKYYQFAGVADRDTDPGSPDENVIYITGTTGTYANFGGIVVNAGEMALLKWDGTWTKQVIKIVPEYTSQLLNDSGFINNAVGNLLNYYLKSETYTKGQVDDLIAAVHQFEFVVADTLPTASADTMYKIYLIPASGSEEDNYKDEYVTILEEGVYSWEKIGSTAVDLSDYPTNEQMAQAIDDAIAAYISSIDASVDSNVGTPSVDVSYSSGVLTLAFHNLKGVQGNPGEQGPPGVTSVSASVDNNTGVPSVETSINAGVLTLTFHNLKGLQGDTGSSVAYPFTLVNNLVTNDATQALTSAMGYMLGNEVFGPIWDLTEVNQYDGYYINKDTGELVSGAASSVTREYLVPDASYKYYATGKFGSNANTCLVCYYKIDGTFISSQFQSTGTATTFDHQELTLPADCAKIRVFGSTPSPMPILSCVSGSLNQRLSSLEKMMGVLIAEEEDERYTPYYINKNTGELVEGSVSSHVYEYDIEDPSIPYYASGRVGANTATCLVAYYTENGTFISSQYGSEGTAVTYEKQVLTVPSTCRKIRVFGFISTLGQQSYPPELWAGSRLPEKVNVIEERLNAYIADNRCKNTGKTVGVFGGSISVYAESQSAKDIWVKKLGVSITDYGVAGAGFSSLQGTTSIQAQVDGAASKDVYILWASTNDYRNNRECGTWSDYTEEDNYDSSKLVTQCGGINYCIKKLLTINPNAEIYFFTPLRFFSLEAGYNPFTDETNTTGKNFAEYIAEMKKCCDYYGIPVLDQFDLQGVNIFNKSLYYKTDNLHMNEAGYEKIGWVQADFLANGE